MHALNKLLQNAALIWRFSDLLAAMAYFTVSLTLLEFTDLSVWLVVAVGYLPCTLLLAALELTSYWNPVLLDLRTAEVREA